MKKEFATFGSYIFSHKNLNWLRTVTTVLVELVETALNVVPPALIIDELIKDITDPDLIKELTPWLIAGSTALVTAQALPNIRGFLIDSLRTNVQKELTYSMVKKAYELEFNQHLAARTGEFSQALTKNYSSVDKGVPSLLGEIVPTLIENAAITGYLTYRFGPIGLTPLGIVLIYTTLAMTYEKLAFQRRVECDQENRKGYTAVLTALGKYLIAHKYGNVDHELNQVSAALKSYEDKSRKMYFRDNWAHFGLSIFNGIGFLSSLLGFYMLLPNDTANFALQFGLYAYFMVRLFNKLEKYPNAISDFMTAVVDGQKISEYLAKKSGINDIDKPLKLNPSKPLKIEFINVSFTYGKKLILKDINFIVERGMHFAIVGPTGSGKSTILKLLLRLYIPDKGEILVNDININKYTAKSLRDCFSIVSQESALFEGTIFDNILYGDLKADKSDVNQAATLAKLNNQADNLLPFDNALDVILNKKTGQAGAMLSGGEKQRVALARSILHGGFACLLDEPTSSLDNITTKQVLQTIELLTTGVSTLTISHRPHVVVNADQIIYLHEGKIIEKGTFNKLLQIEDGEFYKQFSAQCHNLGVSEDEFLKLLPKQSQTKQKQASKNNMITFWHRRNASKQEVEFAPISADRSTQTTPLLKQDEDKGKDEYYSKPKLK